jgi:hypothetical protein
VCVRFVLDSSWFGGEIFLQNFFFVFFFAQKKKKVFLNSFIRIVFFQEQINFRFVVSPESGYLEKGNDDWQSVSFSEASGEISDSP